MNVFSILGGETTALTPSEVLALLRQRVGNQYANCILSHSLYPLLHVEINDLYAWLNYIEVDDLPGFISVGNTHADSPDIDFMDDSEQIIKRPASWVINTALAEQAALEFFESGRRPVCLAWLEL